MCCSSNNGHKNKFKIADRVYAKVKVHSPWPAIIVSIDTKTRLTKYHVKFYGTREVALVKEIDIELFNENKICHEGKKIKKQNVC